jgi:hypothetical protein
MARALDVKPDAKIHALAPLSFIGAHSPLSFALYLQPAGRKTSSQNNTRSTTVSKTPWGVTHRKGTNYAHQSTRIGKQKRITNACAQRKKPSALSKIYPPRCALSVSIKRPFPKPPPFSSALHVPPAGRTTP